MIRKIGFKIVLVSSLLIVLMMAAGFSMGLCAQGDLAKKSLKVALLPILDTFPFYVAEAQGYFDRYGVTVEAVPVGSGLERDQLMQSGAIDGMLNENIEHNDLFLAYQPVMGFKTGRISYLEALVRWNRDGHGIVAPRSTNPLCSSMIGRAQGERLTVHAMDRRH